MQEKLKFNTIPNIDAEAISNVGDFNRSVVQFEEKWNIKLEFNENARWRPGSYERLKMKMVESLFINWSKPKGANTIKKITSFSQYNCKDFTKSLRMIDDSLKDFRRRKETLNEETAKENGSLVLKEFFQSILTPVKNMTVEISSIPWYTRCLRTTYNQTSEWRNYYDRPSHPIFNQNGNIISHSNLTPTDYDMKIEKGLAITDPKRWFINIKYSINDVSINYIKNRKRTESMPIVSTPYGDLIVCFTIPVINAALGYREMKFGKSTNLEYNYGRFEDFSNHTHCFPKYKSILHPFVKKETEHYSYDIGNTCFGDFRINIKNAIYSGQMNTLKFLLDEWSSTYYLGDTTPLNQGEWHHIGLPKEWTEEKIGFPIGNYIGTNTSRCVELIFGEDAIGNNASPEIIKTHQETHCNNCQLANNSSCALYKKWHYKPLIVPETITTLLNEQYSEVPGFKSMVSKTFNIINSSQSNLEMINCYFPSSDQLKYQIKTQSVLKCCREIREYVNNLTSENEINYISKMYLFYKIMERAYINKIARGINIDMYQILNHNYNNYETLGEAENACPIDSIKQIINTACITDNKPIPNYHFDTWILNKE